MGLALSDELRMTAQPLATMERQNRREDLRRLREIVRRHCVRRIVVGLPLHLHGGEGEMATEAKRFARRIQKELGVEVELVDERLTSWAAAETLAEVKGTGLRKSGPADEVAAAVLLREYLERKQPASLSARRRAEP